MVKFCPLHGACSSMAERYTMDMALNMVGVAQLAERIPVEDEVAGSFPVAHPSYLVLLYSYFRRL